MLGARSTPASLVSGMPAILREEAPAILRCAHMRTLARQRGCHMRKLLALLEEIVLVLLGLGTVVRIEAAVISFGRKASAFSTHSFAAGRRSTRGMASAISAQPSARTLPLMTKPLGTTLGTAGDRRGPLGTAGDHWGPLGSAGDRWGPSGSMGTAGVHRDPVVTVGNGR